MSSQMGSTLEEHLKEGEQEKRFYPLFHEYEKWRAQKGEKESSPGASDKKGPVEKGGMKGLDFLFLALGVVAAFVFKSCSS